MYRSWLVESLLSLAKVHLYSQCNHLDFLEYGGEFVESHCGIMCNTHLGFNQTDDLLPKLLQEIETYNHTKGTIRVYKRGTPAYEVSIEHHFENGIKQVTPYVLEPCSELDLIVLIYLLALRKIEFAIKSGGHISIPKIYPPDGVLISMKQFNQIVYNEGAGTLDVGAGVTWGDVYDFLKTPKYNKLGVVGGDPLVGVSGWLLGGGYSLLTNSFGLGMDNVVGYQVLTPSVTNGLQDLPNDPKIRNATPRENVDLFKALKGGGHNFGIVTRFTLQTYPGAERQNLCSKIFKENMSGKVKNAMVKFIRSGAPPQAVASMVFRHNLKKNGVVESYIGLACWYYTDLVFQEGSDLIQFFFGGGESESTSLLDVHEAFALRHLPVSLETLQRTDEDSEFVAFDPKDKTHAKFFNHEDIIQRKILKSITDGADRNSFTQFKAGKKTLILERDRGIRGRMASIMVTTYTLKLLDEAEKQAKKLANMMSGHKGSRVSFEIWPFHKDAFKGITTRDSAWPHEQGKVSGPLVGWFEWSGKENDAFWLGEIKKALEALHEVALKEGCTTKDLPIYLNITLESTSAKEIYGVNYAGLKVVRNKYDPTNVMKQAAGFII